MDRRPPGDLETAVRTADVILTDGFGEHVAQLEPFQITAALLDSAPAGVLLNPCPPFTRGEEVSVDAIEHPAFVGHWFKASLLPVQQAIMAPAREGLAVMAGLRAALTSLRDARQDATRRRSARSDEDDPLFIG